MSESQLTNADAVAMLLRFLTRLSDEELERIEAAVAEERMKRKPPVGELLPKLLSPQEADELLSGYEATIRDWPPHKLVIERGKIVQERARLGIAVPALEEVPNAPEYERLRERRLKLDQELEAITQEIARRRDLALDVRAARGLPSDVPQERISAG